MWKTIAAALIGTILGIPATLAYAKDATSVAIETTADLHRYAATMEKEFDLPKGLLVSICHVESHYRNGLRGRHGEIGVCQLQPSTVKMVFPRIEVASRGKFIDATRVAIGEDDVVATNRIKKFLGVQGELYDGKSKALDKAVRAFQKAVQIREDGIIGPETWGRMFPGEPYPKQQSIEVMLWQPHSNIYLAASYLRWLADTYSDHEGFLISAYNSGPGSQVSRYILKVLDARDNL
jgi:hypothetical protein